MKHPGLYTTTLTCTTILPGANERPRPRLLVCEGVIVNEVFSCY